MKQPNTFIIGAPKCGTTALAEWLSSHPKAFCAAQKEPRFFNYDVLRRPRVNLRAYHQLFRGAGSQHEVVFEATTLYLQSRTAVPAILAYAENPRFVVMVRNPIAMARSLHSQRHFDQYEDEPDFERAWRLQNARLSSRHVPRHCWDPQILLYGRACRLGEHLARLLELAPSQRVHLIRLESMRDDPAVEYRRLLDFLGLEDDGRTEFPVRNAAKEPRFPHINRFIAFGNRMLNRVGIYSRLGFTRAITKRLAHERANPPVRPEFEEELRKYFRADQQRLETLIQAHGLDRK